MTDMKTARGSSREWFLMAREVHETGLGLLNPEESIKGFCASWKRDSVQRVVSEVFWPSGFPYV